jgi:hypothetical protein
MLEPVKNTRCYESNYIKINFDYRLPEQLVVYDLPLAVLFYHETVLIFLFALLRSLQFVPSTFRIGQEKYTTGVAIAYRSKLNFY